MSKNKSKKGKGDKKASKKNQAPRIERNWDELGLMMGLEIHQQLNTKHKLFCPCSTDLTDDEHDEEIIRNLRPTQSELGQMLRLPGFFQILMPCMQLLSSHQQDWLQPQ